MQKEIIVTGDYSPVKEFFESQGFKKIFLVCDTSYQFLKISSLFESMDNIVKFSDFAPNPEYDSVKKAVELYKAEGCDSIVALGGGSAMDLAKCVKLYANMDDSKVYIEQEIVPNDIPLTAIPTTAGTGSEATRYAVIYYMGAKQSVTDYSCIPSTVVFDASALTTLPMYQKKATMLDALCHSIESFWSVNSTDESKEFSAKAIGMILDNMDDYIGNKLDGNINMLKAANLAGKAINITQTTAGHAMCYKLTSLYKVAHGHAAAMCLRKLMPYMIANTDKCIDSRGKEYLEDTFNQIAKAMGCDTPEQMCEKFNSIFDSLELQIPDYSDEDIKVLSGSVNPVRLKNNPVALSEDVIENLYIQILSKG